MFINKVIVQNVNGGEAILQYHSTFSSIYREQSMKLHLQADLHYITT